MTASSYAVKPAPDGTTALARPSAPRIYWVAVGLKRCMLGTVVDDITGNLAKSSDELAATWELYGFVAALTASIIYPSLQHAASFCSIIDGQTGWLGTAYLLFSFCGVFGFLSCGIVSSVYAIVLKCLSEGAANYWRSTCLVELRLPQQLFFSGVWAAMFTVLIEALVRLNVPLNNGDLEMDASWAERPANLAVVIIFALGVLYQVAMLFSIVAKCLRANLVFSADASAFAQQERRALSTGRPAWVASPSADELRTLLQAYWPDGAAGGGAFADPNPRDFQVYVRHTMRARGHGDVSFIACRMAELIFEERVQQLLDATGLKVERDEQLVKPLDGPSA